MHGLYLKRHGSDVVILDQDPSDVRSSHHAGITFGPAVEELLTHVTTQVFKAAFHLPRPALPTANAETSSAPTSSGTRQAGYAKVSGARPAGLDAVLTGGPGVRHGNTVGAGSVRGEVCRRQLAAALPPTSSSPRSRTPCAVPRLQRRPRRPRRRLPRRLPSHLAAATEQAARHCLALGRVWAGKIRIDQRVREAWACFCVYVVFWVRLKLRRE
ncbi:hypothetical protein MFIFM68171_04794 [Madurella fahalii]|uniref:Uncharacterized protein n=1 Tax=Madurella fahalii TaxID=1157608 RepID=A0ABQ0GA37_9PEZI